MVTDCPGGNYDKNMLQRKIIYSEESVLRRLTSSLLSTMIISSLPKPLVPGSDEEEGRGGGREGERATVDVERGEGW